VHPFRRLRHFPALVRDPVERVHGLWRRISAAWFARASGVQLRTAVILSAAKDLIFSGKREILRSAQNDT
jgi:hypothetical protein